jgi:hypothetical protein
MDITANVVPFIGSEERWKAKRKDPGRFRQRCSLRTRSK